MKTQWNEREIAGPSVVNPRYASFKSEGSHWIGLESVSMTTLLGSKALSGFWSPFFFRFASENLSTMNSTRQVRRPWPAVGGSQNAIHGVDIDMHLL